MLFLQKEWRNNLMSFVDDFKKFDAPNHYSRVDANHPLEIWYGLDEKSRKSIELRADFKYREVKGTDSIEINQYVKPKYKTLCFSLKNVEMESLFFKFCEDLVEKTRTIDDVSEGYQTIINRFYQWKKMFINYHNEYLSEPEIMGLIGELLFLKNDLFNRIGKANALKAWSGQELTKKDFSFGDDWFEVKTVSSGKETVRITSLEQLESDTNGELVVYFLEKMSEAYNGITLNSLVLEIVNLLDLQQDKDFLMSKVSSRGYTYCKYYDSYVYEVRDSHRFLVDVSFPKLTRRMVCSAVVKAAYDLSISEIRKHEIR